MLNLTYHSRLLRLCRLRVAVCIASLFSVSIAHGAEPSDEAGIRFFREKIEPVLKAECYECHSVEAKEIQGGLLLDSRKSARRGGDTGPAVVPKNVKESLLIQAIRHEGDLSMPPEKARLAEKTIADFVKWIEIGAPDPREEKDIKGQEPSADPRQHWSFQPVRKVAPPVVKNSAWVRSPIDAFILARLEQQDWQPAPQATRAQWIRRVYFDLTGLPPSPEEIVAFVQDASADAYEKVVDRLLNSPRYGERWAQHWLDVVRYAETEGYEYDRHVPDAWRYRDYAIDSFNRDKPFDRFIVEQIAGDEIDAANPECQTASIFHRLGPVRRNAGNPDIALSRNEVLTERTDVIGTAILGLTVGCARCHNHKLEPISQRDYYRLQAYLAATDEHDIVLASADEKKAWDAKAGKVKREMESVKAEVAKASGAEKMRLTDALEALADQLPPPLPTIPSTWNDFGKRTPIHILKRGVWENKGQPVGPRPPSVLIDAEQEELPADVANPRTQLARWLTSPENPLTARVLANRIWQQHFGVGLVKTANDFGLHGERPSHPELLDWLAAMLMDNGWRLKPLHRTIVLSNAYRQSGQAASSTDAEPVDPENRLHWRFNRRRLTAEEIRDAMLSVSGRLNSKMGGASVMLPVDRELVQQLYKPLQWQVAASAAEYDRRSIYLIAKRNLRLPFFETFDAPALLSSCARRESSTHAPQALEMLNGRLSNGLAEAFARRLERECDEKPERMVERAFWLALGREPTSDERRLAVEFLRDQSLREFALAVFNLNEFLYVP